MATPIRDFGLLTFTSEPLDLDEFHDDLVALADEFESLDDSEGSEFNRSNSVFAETPSLFDIANGNDIFKDLFNMLNVNTYHHPLTLNEHPVPTSIAINLGVESLRKDSNHFISGNFDIDDAPLPVGDEIYSCNKEELLWTMFLSLVSDKIDMMKDGFVAGMKALNADGRFSQFNAILQGLQEDAERKASLLKIPESRMKPIHSEVLTALNRNVEKVLELEKFTLLLTDE
ncbi:hypothetical protein HK100_007016 [Physocladia obscura]|uniref:Uncharacterized protein n=1 Tax=Physocladia obscura TaxID=109957 RepID=A0AAD5SPR8_9FUNG|nr:hypothetical protein HK100_007016 [Physocladia obscura]